MSFKVRTLKKKDKKNSSGDSSTVSIELQPGYSVLACANAPGNGKSSLYFLVTGMTYFN